MYRAVSEVRVDVTHCVDINIGRKTPSALMYKYGRMWAHHLTAVDSASAERVNSCVLPLAGLRRVKMATGRMRTLHRSNGLPCIGATGKRHGARGRCGSSTLLAAVTSVMVRAIGHQPMKMLCTSCVRLRRRMVGRRPMKTLRFNGDLFAKFSRTKE